MSKSTTRKTVGARKRAAGRARTRGQRLGIGYVRVSQRRGRDGEQFQSPRTQKQIATAYAKSQGVRIIRWIEDIDQSGGNYERPGFQEALQAIDDGEAQVIVVAKLTRFARSVLDTHRALKRMEKAGGQLLAADLNVDVTTSQGRMIRGIITVLAEFELDVARENWRSAQADAIDRGIYIAPNAPFGYRFDESHRLVIHTDEAKAVRQMFKQRAKKPPASNADLVELLAQHGRNSSFGGIRFMLKNRAYRGEVRWGKDEDALINEHAHKPIVSEDEWQAAQLGRPAHERRNGASLLSGILVCATCERPMTTSSTGRGQPSYRCQRYSSDGKCNAPVGVLQDRADEYVEAEFLRWAQESGAAKTTVELREDKAARQDEDNLAAALAELDAYQETELASVIGPQKYREQVVKRERAAVEARVKVAQHGGGKRKKDAAKVARDEWADLSVVDKRELMAAVIESVVVQRLTTPGARSTPFADRVVSFNWRGV